MGEKEKVKLFFDLDDTVLLSSEAVIDILNQKNGTNKTYDDLRDWCFKSIDHNLSRKEAFDIFSSEEFFDIVKVNPTFEKLYDEEKDNCEFIFVSKGTPKNLKMKQKLIDEKFPAAKFYPCLIFDSDTAEFDKSNIDMKNGIQIDDRFDCMSQTNAAIKILLRTKEFKWNTPTKTIDNLYEVKNFDEVYNCIKFFLKNKEIIGE